MVYLKTQWYVPNLKYVYFVNINHPNDNSQSQTLKGNILLFKCVIHFTMKFRLDYEVYLNSSKCDRISLCGRNKKVTGNNCANQNLSLINYKIFIEFVVNNYIN